MEKLHGLEWTDATPKELISIEWEGGIFTSRLSGDLTISGLASLDWVVFLNNEFSSVSITDCPKLTSISCGENYVGEHFVLSGCRAVTELECRQMGLTSLGLSGLPELSVLACSDNKELASLDLSKTPKLTALDCHSCGLTSLDISVCPSLSFLHCYDNHIHFSQLPLPSGIETYQYAPQYINYGEVGGIVVNAGELIDLTAYQHSNKTVFEWYQYVSEADYEHIVDLNEDGKIDDADRVTVEEVASGKFAIPEWAYDSYLACAMSNADFPDFSGDDRMGVVVQIGENSSLVYQDSDVNVLKALLEQDTNASRLGLASDWASTANWQAQVAGVEWTTDATREIKTIDWESKSLTGSFAISGLASLTTLNCLGNAFASVAITDCPQLTSISCGENAVGANFVLSGCQAVTELGCGEMGLTSLDLSDLPELTLLACPGNGDLASLDLSNTPKLTALDCHSCGLTSLDISVCPSLSLLHCYGNYIALSQLPLPGNLADYRYAPQYIDGANDDGEVNTGEIEVGGDELIDLTAYLYNDKTVFEWYRYQDDATGLRADVRADRLPDSAEKVTLEEVEPGKFTVPEWANDYLLTCVITNADFPDFTADNRIEVAVRVVGEPTGNVLVYERNEVLYLNGVLTVTHPVAEWISVYSPQGMLLYSVMKGEATLSLDLNHLPSTLLFIKGSSGW